MIDIREHGIGAGGLSSFFGDGSDGALNTAGNVTLSTTAHTGLVVKQYSSITINAGHTLTVDNPCRGLVLYCQGDVNISGTIDMSKKAGFGVAEIPPLLLTKLQSNGTTKTIEKYYQLATVLQKLAGGAGGAGGYGGKQKAAGGASRPSGGTGGIGRLLLGGFGGGGGAGTSGAWAGGVGGSIPFPELGGGKGSVISFNVTGWNDGSFDGHIAGTDGSNGSGGSGTVAFTNTTETNTKVFGPGKGGDCNGGGGGGGQSINIALANSAFIGSSGGNGDYSGGFILIICNNLNISATGKILSNGGNGGYGCSGSGALAGSGGGGGAGGGVVAIFYKGLYQNDGEIQVNGGTGGTGGTAGNTYNFEDGGSGSSGSVGTIHTQKIA